MVITKNRAAVKRTNALSQKCSFRSDLQNRIDKS